MSVKHVIYAVLMMLALGRVVEADGPPAPGYKPRTPVARRPCVERGHWFIPVSLAYAQGQHVEWVQQVDPSLETQGRWGVGVGVGRMLASQWAWSAQVMEFEDGGARWMDRPYGAGEPSTNGKGRAFMVTVQVPLQWGR